MQDRTGLHPDPERAHGLAGIESEYPWRTWVGIGGLMYASRLATSPPCVVRDTSVDGLRTKVAAEEQRRAR